MDPLLTQVRQTLQDYRMLEGAQTLLVAVSGGPDSMALLHALARLRESFAVELLIAHLNHRLRPGAGADARFVEAVARELGLPCICRTLDVPAYQRLHKLSPEDAARRVRYGFLSATADRHRAERIAVGHTADDQAETLLLRMLRGAGLSGLSAMPPVRGRIIRPLIRVHRRDVLAFLKAHGIPFREDPSNRERHYVRNRIRLDLLPRLQRDYNPRVAERLCTMADLLAADEAALQQIAREHLHALRLPGPAGAVCLRLDPLRSLLPALQRRVLREALREAAGGLEGFSHRHIAATLELLQREAGHKRLDLPRGVVAERSYDVLCVHRASPPPAVALDMPLPVPGHCPLDPLGLTLVSRLEGRASLPDPFPVGDTVWLDAASVGRELRVRTRRPGDRFQPLGSPHPKKLKRFLIDAKIPQGVRDRLPLLVGPRGIAWVVGIRPAEWAKVTPHTREVLVLQAVRHSN